VQKTITNKVVKTEPVKWRELKFLQSENLKDIGKPEYEKLKKSLLENNFIQTFNVWQDKKEIYLLDGHHRVKLLFNLEQEGYSVPDTFPANFIQCKTRKEASKYLLIYSSIYAKVDRDGLYEFFELEGLDLSELLQEIQIPDIKFDYFDKNFNNDPDVEKLEKLEKDEKSKKELINELWQENNMPECENEEGKPPEVMVVIKCATVEDFEELKGLLEEEVYKTTGIFKGANCKENIKTTWYPLKKHWGGSKNLEYQTEEEN
jgi:hypothetical protein